MEQMSLELSQPQPHIGIRLKMAREAMGLSSVSVASALKIQPNYIEAIEALDRQALPSIGYVLGYVRTYAGHVGLDSKGAVEDFKIDSEVPENLGMRDRPHFVPKRQIRLPKGFFAASTILSTTAVLGLWYASKTDANSTALTAMSSINAESRVSQSVAIDPNRMLIKANAPSWIEIKDKDGKVVISRILVTDESWEARQDAGVMVSARDSGALNLYIGENFMGRLGAKGTPISNVVMPAVSPDYMSDYARKLAGLPLRVDVKTAELKAD